MKKQPFNVSNSVNSLGMPISINYATDGDRRPKLTVTCSVCGKQEDIFFKGVPQTNVEPFVVKKFEQRGWDLGRGTHRERDLCPEHAKFKQSTPSEYRTIPTQVPDDIDEELAAVMSEERELTPREIVQNELLSRIADNVDSIPDEYLAALTEARKGASKAKVYCRHESKPTQLRYLGTTDRGEDMEAASVRMGITPGVAKRVTYKPEEDHMKLILTYKYAWQMPPAQIDPDEPVVVVEEPKQKIKLVEPVMPTPVPAKKETEKKEPKGKPHAQRAQLPFTDRVRLHTEMEKVISPSPDVPGKFVYKDDWSDQKIADTLGAPVTLWHVQGHRQREFGPITHKIPATDGTLAARVKSLEDMVLDLMEKVERLTEGGNQ